MFNQVQLGTYKERLRAYILTADPGGVEDFAIALFRLDTPKGFIPSPIKIKIDSITHYRLFFSEYMALVKISNMRLPLLQDFYIAPGKDILAYIWNYTESKDFKQVVAIAKKAFIQAQRK